MGLDTAEFILWAEQEFEVGVPERDAENILTVGQFSSYIQGKMIDKFGTRFASETEIFERIKNFLAAEFNIAPDKITRQSYFVKDLRLDQ